MPQPVNQKPSAKVSSTGKVKTRERLIEAGLALFSSYGFEGVSISDLERAVGLKAGTGSYYRHFPDKEALLKTIFSMEIEKAKNRRRLELEAIAKDAEDIREALRQQFSLTLSHLEENKQALDLLMKEQNRFPEFVKLMRKELFEKALSEVVTHYSRRISTGDMITIEPRDLASVTLSSLFGFQHLALLYGKSMDEQLKDNFIETLVDLLIAKQ